MNEKEGIYLIGEYLVYSSWLEKHINQCLDHFQFDKPVFDSIQKESFDFKCKRLRNYLHILEAYHHLDQQDLTYYYEHLGSLEVEFIPVRRLRNLLAHAIVDGSMIHSSRRLRGENSLGMNMTTDELMSHVSSLKLMVTRAETFFDQFEKFLSQHKKRKGPLQDPLIQNRLDQ